jgi:hypothetical protein
MNRSVLVLFLLAALVVLGCSEAKPPAEEIPRGQRPGEASYRPRPPNRPPAPAAAQPATGSKGVGGSTGGVAGAGVAAAKTAATPAAGGADAAKTEDNPLLREFLAKGIEMPDGSVMKLSPPILSEGIDAAAVKAAIEKIMPMNCSFEDFTAKDSRAPLGLKIRTPKRKKPDYKFRTIDLGFVAYGNWKTLKSEKFFDSLLRRDSKAKQSDTSEASAKFGALTKEELAKRGLKSIGGGGREDRYIYSTVSLFDLVEIRATRYGVLTESPTSLVLAAGIDPRFATDAEYPNQWRAIDKDALGQKVLGEKHPYLGAAFYLKATSLSTLPGAIFFEFHSAYNEPKGWFEEEPDKLRRKLPTIVQFKVQQFREKLSRFKPEKEAAAKPAGK